VVQVNEKSGTQETNQSHGRDESDRTPH